MNVIMEFVDRRIETIIIETVQTNELKIILKSVTGFHKKISLSIKVNKRLYLRKQRLL